MPLIWFQAFLPAKTLATAAMAMGYAAAGPATAADLALPSPEHVVVVVMENHSLTEIMDAGKAPFISSLAADGALFTNSFAVARPSQPNYFALFTGSTHGVKDNDAHQLSAPTLAGSLQAKDRTFLAYVEHGSPRRHNPWDLFNKSSRAERDFAEFPDDFRQSYRPSVSSSQISTMTCTRAISDGVMSGCNTSWAVMPSGVRKVMTY